MKQIEEGYNYTTANIEQYQSPSKHPLACPQIAPQFGHPPFIIIHVHKCLAISIIFRYECLLCTSIVGGRRISCVASWLALEVRFHLQNLGEIVH
jgi:hypothetical protein